MRADIDFCRCEKRKALADSVEEIASSGNSTGLARSRMGNSSTRQGKGIAAGREIRLQRFVPLLA